MFVDWKQLIKTFFQIKHLSFICLVLHLFLLLPAGKNVPRSFVILLEILFDNILM